MLCCDEGFSVLGSVQKIFKLGKLNKPQWSRPKGLIQGNISYHLCLIFFLKNRRMSTHKWNDVGKMCGQHCFWLNYRLLIFRSSDFSITQLRKPVGKPGDREGWLLETHRKLLPSVHSHPRTTTKGQLGFWSKVTMWTEICPIVPPSARHSMEMQGETALLPLDVMSGSWGVVASRIPKAEAGHACLQLQAAGTADWPNILPAICMAPNSQLYDTGSLFLHLLANTVSGFATWPWHLLHTLPELKYLALASYISSLTLNFTVCKMGS